MSGTAVGAFGFDAAWGAVAAERGWVEGGCSSARTRRTAGGLGFDSESGASTEVGTSDGGGGEEGIELGRSDSLRERCLLYRLR